MGILISTIKKWDRDMNGLLRKTFLVVLVLACCFLLILITPYCLPFILALLITAVMRPLVEMLLNLLSRLPAGRKAATFAVMVILYGTVSFLFYLLARQLMLELKNLASSLPSIFAWVNNLIEGWMESFAAAVAKDPSFTNVFSQTLESLAQSVITATKSLAKDLTGSLASGALGTASNVPRTLLFIVMTVMASFYFTSDMPRIQAFLRKSLPRAFMEKSASIKRSVVKALFGQIRSQLIISLLVMLVVILGLLILGIPYALLLGLVIGIADALPIVGAGLFLLPWAAFNLFAGNMTLGIGLLLLYVAVIVTRQIAEPRIVGKRLGLYPLVSMFSMYVSFVLMGYLGLLAGPIVANLCKVVLETDKRSSELMHKAEKAPEPPKADAAQ